MFLANYSDGLSDLLLPDMIAYFQNQPEAVACFVGVTPTSSFPVVQVNRDGSVRSIGHIKEAGMRMNGGFFVLRKQIFDYMDEATSWSSGRSSDWRPRGSSWHTSTTGSGPAWTLSGKKQVLEDMCSRGQVPWEVWKSRPDVGRATR
jgi:glucose-1-phosphate cytidylyltransferase